jgi:hypothetical protein
MNVMECELERSLPSMENYTRDIETLLREEGDRIRRILKVIDESMIAIHKTRQMLND